jgi:hypothetical protein
MNWQRYLPLFSVVFILAYAASVYFNLALFTYFPAGAQPFVLFAAKPGAPPAGIPMYWYGWLATTFLMALAVTVVGALVTGHRSRGVWPWLVWASPIAALLVVLYVLRMWFVR